MQEQPFARENNARLSTITNLAARGPKGVDVAFVPKPHSKHEFTVFLRGQVGKSSGETIRTVQQALFDEFGCYTSIARVRQHDGCYQVSLVPDIKIEEDFIKMRDALTQIASNSNNIQAITHGYQKDANKRHTFTTAP